MRISPGKPILLGALAGWTLAGAIVIAPRSARADAPAVFTDEAIARGVDYAVAATLAQWGCGVALVDLDGDRDPDLVVTGRGDGRVGVYENLGAGAFTDRSVACGIPALLDASSVSAADYDGDGDLDLFFANHFEANVLARNDGAFTFTDVAPAAGLDDAGPAMGAAWADVDGDGWLDLYVPNRTGAFGATDPNRMYVNQGDGAFVEVGEALGIDRAMDPTLVAAFFDYDRDGDADLYLGNDKGTSPNWQNHLFENDGTGLFTDVTAATGTAANVDCMGIAVGDVTHDGRPDLYVTNTPPGHKLLLSQPDGTFADASVTAGVQSFAIGWGTDFLDWDNDGWLDLFVCQTLAPNRLYDYDGAWPATDVAPALHLDETAHSYCFAHGDVDGDGDLDLVVQSSDRNIGLHVNPEGSSRAWIRFDVRGAAPNRFAVGARVDVRTGATWRTGEVRAGTAFKSQNEYTLHFGLGESGGGPIVPDEIVVHWPTGETRTITGLPAGHVWTVLPDVALGDGDDDGDVDLDDFLAFLDCRTGPGAGLLAPGCEPFDLDGDGDVDDDDLDLLLARYTGPDGDCNGSGTSDLSDIASGASIDANADGVPDECACAADLDGNGTVGFGDLSALLGRWGPCAAPCAGDVDGSGAVGFADLSALLGAWGPCP